MKIEYRTPPGTGAFSVLADEADGGAQSLSPRITGYCPSFGKVPMVVRMFQQVSPQVGDMGNATWDLAFGIERDHGTPDAAAAFLAVHAAVFGNVLGNYDLQITTGGTVILAADCALKNFKPRPPSDRSSFIEYGWTPTTYMVAGAGQTD